MLERKNKLITLARMVSLIALLICSTSAFAGDSDSDSGDSDSGSRKTVILGANVIDGNGGAPLLDATIVIHRGKIKKIGPSGSIQYPANATVIQASDKWVVPGLVDTHTHIWESSRLYGSPAGFDLRAYGPHEEEVEWVMGRVEYTLTRFLAGGVTATVDIGGPFWSFGVRELAEGNDFAPRFAAAGRFIGDFNLEEFNHLFTLEDPGALQALSPEHARELTLENLSFGPELIKSGYFGAIPLDDYLDVLAVIIEESHNAGVRVAVHAFGLEAAKEAMRLGADILAHNLLEELVDEEFLQLAKDNDVICITTLMLLERLGNVVEQNIDFLPLEQETGDPEVLETFDDLADIPPEDIPDPGPLLLNVQDKIAIQMANLAAMHAAGIRIAIGSDSGNMGILHGASFHRELERVSEAGIPNMDLIVAATRNGAEVFKENPDFGTLEKNKLADMLIVSANPLDDLANLQSIEYVIKGGHVFPHEELAEITQEEIPTEPDGGDSDSDSDSDSE